VILGPELRLTNAKHQCRQRILFGIEFEKAKSTMKILCTMTWIVTKNHPNAFDDIDPSNIVQHTATKFEKMWKEVNGRWKKIVAKFNTSGQHDYEFLEFLRGTIGCPVSKYKSGGELVSCLHRE
jgi:hypothetical protein